ncbi:MAG: MFS transporter, partial [Sphingobium sp.]|nr:MFS transporter [Sphingobium sp.]
LIGTAIAPLVLVALADAFGWRAAFYLAGVPGLILALLIWRFIAEPPQEPRAADHAPPPLLPVRMLANRNIAVCSLISCLMVGSLVIGSIFLPLYFTGPRGWEPATMSRVMAVLGLCPGVGGVLVSWLSDKIGRRPPMIAGCFIAAACPFAALYFGGSIPALTAIMFVAYLGIGMYPLYMGVVPSETLKFRNIAAGMGIVDAVGELTGGVMGPIVAGWLADRTTLETPLLIAAAMSLGGG